MENYAESTKDRREKKGRQTGLRDLSFTGSMLRSMNVSSIKRDSRGYTATISFSRRQDAIKAFWNQKREKWFGVSRKDSKILTAIAEKRLQEKLQE